MEALKEMGSYLENEDDEVRIWLGDNIGNLTPPTFPSHLVLGAESNLERVGQEDLNAYFECLPDSRLIFFQGLKMPHFVFRLPAYYCDYCRVTIPNKDGFYHCQTCHTDACHLCNEEMVSGEPTPGSQRYEERKDALDVCKVHERKHICFWKMYDYRSCDECGEKIVGGPSYTTLDMWNSFDEELHEDCKDICMACAEGEEGKTYIEENDLHFFDRRVPGFNEVCHFGPVAPWYPVLKRKDSCGDDDGESDYVCLPMQDNLPWACVLVLRDDHGRTGMIGLTLSLDEVVSKLETMSVKKLAESLNFQTHYG